MRNFSTVKCVAGRRYSVSSQYFLNSVSLVALLFLTPARSAGWPKEPLAATDAILDALRRGSERRINLGAANGRYFAFNVGFGFDAAVVVEVERRHRFKRAARQAAFLWWGWVTLMWRFDGAATDITVAVPGAGSTGALKTVLCCNTTPFAYLGRSPVHLCPDASLDLGLDLTALDRLRAPGLLRLLGRAVADKELTALPWLHVWHDLDAAQLRSSAPLPLQVDGDYVGETERVALCSVPRAVTVVVV
jgi:diacylglycerol kinase family enzyme